MARKEKHKKLSAPVVFGMGGLVVLIIVAVINLSSVISFIIILALLVISGVWLYKFWKNFEIRMQRQSYFDEMPIVKSVNQMGFLTPTDFEHYVALLFEKLGYSATVTKQSGDGGIDIILKKDNKKIAVQVKRYLQGGVGRPELQKLVGASFKNFDEMIFVTTSYYSPEAYVYAAEHNIELIDGEKLDRMSKNTIGENYTSKALFHSILQK